MTKIYQFTTFGLYFKLQDGSISQTLFENWADQPLLQDFGPLRL